MNPEATTTRRTRKDPADPSYRPNRRRDNMTPEEWAVHRRRILARRRARNAARRARAAAVVQRMYSFTHRNPGGDP